MLDRKHAKPGTKVVRTEEPHTRSVVFQIREVLFPPDQGEIRCVRDDHPPGAEITEADIVVGDLTQFKLYTPSGKVR